MICGVSKETDYVLKCDGCGLPMCEGCLQYGLFGTACGCIEPLYLCRICFDDPGVNRE